MAGDLESSGRRCQILGRDSLPRGRRGNNGRPKDLVDSGPKSAPKSPPFRRPSGRFLIDPPLPPSFAGYVVRLADTFCRIKQITIGVFHTNSLLSLFLFLVRIQAEFGRRKRRKSTRIGRHFGPFGRAQRQNRIGHRRVGKRR